MCWLTSTTFSGVPNRECTKFARSWYHWSYFVCCSTCTLTIKQFKEKSAVDFKNNVGWGLKWSTCQMFGLIFLLSRVWAQREDHTSNRGDLWLVRCLVSLISSLVFILWKFDQSNEFFSMVILGCTRLFYSWVNFIGIEILILKKKKKKTETTAYNMVRKTEATAYNMVVKKKKKFIHGFYLELAFHSSMVPILLISMVRCDKESCVVYIILFCIWNFME